jgi:trk system potassium uptake protein TrkA
MERFAVIGLGRFGTRLATLLADAGAEVLAVDCDKGRVEAISERVTLAVCLDSTDEEALRAQDIDKVDVAIVGIGSAFEAAVLTTVTLKQLGVPQVIARATTGIRGQILLRIGADDIVNPEKESAERWRGRLLAPAILERVALAEGHSLAQVAAPQSFVGKTLQELDFAKKYKLLVVAIRRSVPSREGKAKEAGRPVIVSPPGPDALIQAGDVLVVIGSDDAVEALPRR